MTTTRLTAQYGTYVSERYPTARLFRRHDYASVSGQRGARSWTLLWFANPFGPEGGNVARATLTFQTRGVDKNTSHAVTAQLAGDWSRSFHTLDWTSKPSGAGPRTDATRTGTLPDRTVWGIDVTAQMQQVADGSRLQGLLLWGPADNGDAVTIDLRTGRMPYLEVEWSTAPLPPGELAPASNGVIGTPTPILRWNFYDHVGDTDLQAVQVQTSTSETGFGSPSWDSGVVSTTLPQLDLASAGFPAPASGQTVWWRVRNQDGSGIWSGWSTPASWRWMSLPTVGLVNPDATGWDSTNPGVNMPTVTDPTPPINWTCSPGQGGSQTRWQVRISQRVGGVWRTVDDSGITQGSATRWTPSIAMTQEGTYQVWVRCWDGQSTRVATPGFPVYGQAFTNFVYRPTSSTVPPRNLGVDVSGAGPRVTLTWRRAEQPDEWLVTRDGKVVSRRPGNDFANGTGAYLMRDALCPNGVHTWGVQAVVNGKASQALTFIGREDHHGTWLVDTDDYRMVCITGDDTHEMTMPETTTTLTPIGSPRSIVVTSGYRGWEGTISGVITTMPGLTDQAAEQRATLLDWKTMSGHRFRLLVEDMSIPVCISNVQTHLHPGRAGARFDADRGEVAVASFDFHQVDEYGFEVA